VNLRNITNCHVLPVALLVYACAKVTTNYPDVDGGTDVGIGGNAGNGGIGIGGSTGNGGTGTGGTAKSVSVGGAPLTGGTKGVGLGGLTSLSGITGGSPNTGGAKATGGSIPGTGGTPPTGGSPPIIVGDAGPFCPAGAAFCDDFESYTGGTATQWTAGTGSWSVTTDATELAGDQRVYANTSTSNSVSSVSGGTYANATIEARMRVMSFSSNSASNSAGIFLRSNGTNDYDLSLGGDGKIYLRRSQTSSTEETCSSGLSNGPGVSVTTAGGSGWFKLKLQVSGTVATGITVTGWVDPTGSSGYTQALQCTQVAGTQYMYDSGSAGVFSKSNAPAEYDDVVITSP
jgi:hypothetical protein